MKRKVRFYLCGLLLLPVLLLVNGILFYSTKCGGEYLQSENVWGVRKAIRIGDFKRQQQIVHSLPKEPEEALAAVEEIIDYLEKEANLKGYSEEYIKYMEFITGEVLVERPIEPEDNGLIPKETLKIGINFSDYENYRSIKEQLKNVIGYREYVKGIGENAGMIADSLYSIRGDKWLLKNLAKCQQDYYGLEYLELSMEEDYTITTVLDYHITDMVGFLYILLLTVAYCLLIKKNSFGEVQNVRHTTIGLFAAMIVGLAGLYISNFVLVGKVYGFPNLSVPLQSLDEFYGCAEDITVGGFLACYIGIKIVTQLVVLGIGILAFTGRHRIVGCSLVAAAAVAEYLLQQKIPAENAGSFFGEINVFSGFMPERFFNRYLNLNVFGLVVPRLPLFLTLLTAGLLAVLFFVYKRFGLWHKKSKQEALNTYFSEIDKRYQETRLLWHDFHNHLLAVKALYENGRAEQAERYIEELSEQSHARLLPAKSGSDTVDLLLFKKQEQAGEAGVRLQFKMDCSLEGISVSDYELCSLFGNLLDNAIEATQKVEMEEPVVFLHMDRQNSMLFISCENPYTGELMKQDGELKTTKKDTARHGIGLASVKHICKKYNGSVELETENQLFRVSVLLNV